MWFHWCCGTRQVVVACLSSVLTALKGGQDPKEQQTESPSEMSSPCLAKSDTKKRIYWYYLNVEETLKRIRTTNRALNSLKAIKSNYKRYLKASQVVWQMQISAFHAQLDFADICHLSTLSPKRECPKGWSLKQILLHDISKICGFLHADKIFFDAFSLQEQCWNCTPLCGCTSQV